jgi:hypothetical protein
MRILISIFAVLSTILFLSCEKDNANLNATACAPSLFVAPCSIPEKVFPANSRHFNGSTYDPQAKYRIDLADTSNLNAIYEISFNKIPTTGLYKMVTFIDTTNASLPNQISMVQDSGSFLFRSDWSVSEDVYVDNANNKITISYCNISDEVVVFNTTYNCYIGIKPKTEKLVIN